MAYKLIVTEAMQKQRAELVEFFRYVRRTYSEEVEQECRMEIDAAKSAKVAFDPDQVLFRVRARHQNGESNIKFNTD